MGTRNCLWTSRQTGKVARQSTGRKSQGGVTDLGYELFEEISRSDRSPSGHNESNFHFLNRSATKYFSRVRDLIEDWLSRVPPTARKEMIGTLQKEDRQFDSAFWELFLHEAYRRSGYSLEIHPEVAEGPNKPDFLVRKDETAFYVEAVSVGEPPDELSQRRRLDAVHDVLSSFKTTGFTIGITSYNVGKAALATRNLRKALGEWLAPLDPKEVAREAEMSTLVGFSRLPHLRWRDNGWVLEFHAFPRVTEVQEEERSALGVMSPGEATIVDNVTGIRRVLNEKRGKYGKLSMPLVIAVQSNTTFPTKDYEFERALFGVGPLRPPEMPSRLNSMIEDGFWLTKKGWRNGHLPQVISIAGLSPWKVTSVTPALWSTLEPRVVFPEQPSWLAPVTIAAEAIRGNHFPASALFDLEADWPGPGDPDFEIS